MGSAHGVVGYAVVLQMAMRGHVYGVVDYALFNMLATRAPLLSSSPLVGCLKSSSMAQVVLASESSGASNYIAQLWSLMFGTLG